jgi:hypothetical protein
MLPVWFIVKLLNTLFPGSMVWEVEVPIIAKVPAPGVNVVFAIETLPVTEMVLPFPLRPYPEEVRVKSPLVSIFLK